MGACLKHDMVLALIELLEANSRKAVELHARLHFYLCLWICLEREHWGSNCIVTSQLTRAQLVYSHR